MPDVESIGKYEIRREIGRGAMGVVYEAYDPMIKRVVALKTIRRDALGGEGAAEMVNRFRREAQAAGRLNHPNIVSIYDFGEEAGTWYIAMEFVKGRELKAAFEANERFRIADVVRIMGEILGALDYSHRQGVVHRDVKPANIFLLDNGSVKVADFGIAHVEASNLTQVGTVLGTPAYMSPEQILGVPVDGRSDLFSAGVILYQFLTGERPFTGSSATTMQKVLKEDPLPPSSLNVQVLPVMDAVLRKALAKNADERYQTAQELADAIRAAAPGSAAAATTTAGAAEATVVAATSVSAKAAPASGPTARPADAASATAANATSAKGVPAVAVVVVVAAIAVAAGAWLAWQRFGPDAARTAQAPAPAVAQATSPAPPAPAPAAPAPVTDAGTVTVAAVGIADASDPRWKGDKALVQEEARADAKKEAVSKALGLLVDTKSLATNYDLLNDRLLANSGNFIKTVVRESEPRVGKDGLTTVTTEAVVNVRALQKSLNDMTRDERVEVIRANGDPKVSVQVTVRDSDQPDAPPQLSPVAENILKERIKSFGFRTWTEGGRDGSPGADFAVRGEAKVKKLSVRLEASGLVATKYGLTSWTVKCVDLATGEEIYFNTALPKGVGSWATEEEALKAIGGRIADEFSRDFFLSHANVATRRISLAVAGLPDAATEDALGRELVGLPQVIAAKPQPPSKPRVYELTMPAGGGAGDVVAEAVLKPLNAKLGQACFALGATTGDSVGVTFDARCADASILSRLESNPPAGLYGAPPSRQKGVIRDPATLRKLTT